MQLILSEWLVCGKMWKNMQKRLFFRAAMAGLGKYRMGGHGRIGVYRVKFDMNHSGPPQEPKQLTNTSLYIFVALSGKIVCPALFCVSHKLLT